MRRRRFNASSYGALALAWAAVASHLSGQSTTASSDRALATLYRRGAYSEVIAQAGTGPGGTATMPTRAALLVRALTDVGRPRDAVARAEAWRSNVVVAPAVAVALTALGELDAADAAWTVALRGPDALRARVERLRLQDESGDRASAQAGLETLLAAVKSRGGARTASDAHALALAARMLGRTNPERVKDALRFYDQSWSLDSARLDVRSEIGQLFVEKFNYADARTTLQQVLAVNPRHPQALASMVRLNAAEGRGGLRDPLAALLAVDTESADGRMLAARRLIDAEQYGAAEAEARRGLANDSTAPGPWVAIAAARWLANDTAGHRVALARAHQRLSGSALAEVELAEVSARNRQYRDAVSFARTAVQRDSTDSRALALLGVNLLRVGQPSQARGILERAFAIDPFNVWVKNTLDLLDAYATARTVPTQHFDLVIESGDAELLSLYAAPLVEEAYAALTTRYGFTPSERVRIEFFRSHADFSVRGVGLAGLGALGVAFGNVLAIDAPPARARGEFNWATVIWHEFAHTITLGMTNNRVPRWVSEGLSVREERRARPEWGGGVTPMLIAAYSAGQLRPVSRLNDGFVQPRFDQEVILSYALAAYVFEMLEERKGMDGIRALLAGYRDGRGTAPLMQEVYGLAPLALDSTFNQWFRAKFAREFTSVAGTVRTTDTDEARVDDSGALRDAVRAAESAAQQKKWPQAISAAKRAVALFPAFADAGSAYHLLFTASSAIGDSAGAREALAAIAMRNGDAVDENVALAALFEAARDTTGALDALGRAALADPYDLKVQARLGELAVARRDWTVAVRARRAVVALAPADRAEALYRLSQALAGAGDLVGAKREVLRSLDLAPNFEAAQDLLLSIRSSGKAP